MNDAFLRSLDLNTFVGRLVAFQFGAAARFVAYESLFAFENENRTIDEVEIVFAILVDYVGNRVQVAGSLRNHVTSVVRPESERTVSLPNQVEKSVGRPVIN